jgi:beta-aspartyl-peptidase (threonine type)
MDAAIMDGRTLKAGAVAMVEGIKNPVSLAKKVLSETNQVLLCGDGAQKLAQDTGIRLASDNYL